MSKQYETVIGLEVHVELATKTKIFCACSTAFGGAPNTHTCPVCTGMPGSLPVLNEKVVDYAIRMGHALGCKINNVCKQDRKNYFYPDLPKAYQISQYDVPLCEHGHLDIIMDEEGNTKSIGVTRIHIEEDAGKLLHSDRFAGSLVDLNRCGVPLIEIVSEPDIRSSKEAKSYLDGIRAILGYLDISDCKMQEGSIRCDVNVSVRPKGSDTFGTRVEMKNVNSFSAAERAIDYEAARQIAVLEKGGVVLQETRRWDDAKGTSYAMRSKEDAQDYKYFPEPDLPPIELSDEYIDAIRQQLPELPEAKKARYKNEYGLTDYDTDMICSSVSYVRLFERTVEITGNPKDSAHWIMGEVMKLLNDSQTLPEDMRFNPDALGRIIQLQNGNKISRDSAKKVLAAVFTDNVDPDEYVKQNKMEMVSDTGAIRKVVEDVLAQNEKAVNEYKGGKAASFNFLIGQCMRALRGKAPAAEVTKILKEILG